MKIVRSEVTETKHHWPGWTIEVQGEDGWTITGHAASESAAESTRIRFEGMVEGRPAGTPREPAAP